jgi:hypothetical protein
VAEAKSSIEKWSDRRRRYTHWQVTVKYIDQQVFGRVYTDRAKAEKFAARQERSPVVLSTRIEETINSRVARGEF